MKITIELPDELVESLETEWADALTEEERRRKYEKAEAMLERVRVRPVRKPGWEPLL